MYPLPPIPDMYGSTTLSAAAVAKAASTALPPDLRISIPASDARGCAEATAPRVPIATGRCANPRFGQAMRQSLPIEITVRVARHFVTAQRIALAAIALVR